MNKLAEIITRGIVGVLKQGKPATIISADGSPSCVYRTDDGRACVAGHMFDDQFYNSNFEGATAGDQVVLHAINRTHGTDIREATREAYLLKNIQEWHDDLPARCGEQDYPTHNLWISRALDLLPRYLNDGWQTLESLGISRETIMAEVKK